jgi:hypothetical protein
MRKFNLINSKVQHFITCRVIQLKQGIGRTHPTRNTWGLGLPPNNKPKETATINLQVYLVPSVWRAALARLLCRRGPLCPEAWSLGSTQHQDHRFLDNVCWVTKTNDLLFNHQFVVYDSKSSRLGHQNQPQQSTGLVGKARYICKELNKAHMAPIAWRSRPVRPPHPISRRFYNLPRFI